MDVVKTLAIIKPDSLRNKNVGKILGMIEESGLAVEAMKMVRLTPHVAGEFYAEHRGKPFYEGLVEFMSSGPCIVLALSGEDAIARWRKLMGATDPAKAEPGTIRNLFGTIVQQNACHGSDAPETARREISFFFSGTELL